MAGEGLLEPRREIRVCGAVRPDVEMPWWATRSVRARLRGGVLRGLQQRVRMRSSRLAALDGAGAEHGDCRYFRLNGQCLQCSPQAVKIVQNTNLLFTVSMTIAMVLLPTEFLAVW